MQDDLSKYLDFVLNVGEKIFSDKATPYIPVKLGAAHEYVCMPATPVRSCYMGGGGDRTLLTRINICNIVTFISRKRDLRP